MRAAEKSICSFSAAVLQPLLTSPVGGSALPNECQEAHENRKVKRTLFEPLILQIQGGALNITKAMLCVQSFKDNVSPVFRLILPPVGGNVRLIIQKVGQSPSNQESYMSH